jgi:sugar lactone lactonase YvrE
MILSRALCIAVVFQLQFLQQLSSTCPSYTISTIAGTGTSGFGGDGGAATAALLNSPYGVWGDDVNSLYIADHDNHRVRKVNLSTGIITTFAGTGANLNNGDGGLAVDAGIRDPSHMVGGSDGTIYINDEKEYVIRAVNSSGYISTAAGTGAKGYNGDNILATSATLEALGYLCSDTDNNKLYFTEIGGGRLRQVDLSTGLITTVAGDGANTYSGDGGLATSAQLAFPRGLWLDSSGNIFIGTKDNCRVRRIDAVTGIITTFAGTGE